MSKQRDGVIERKGKIYARVYYRDGAGRERVREKLARNRTHAKELRRQMLAELRTRGDAGLTGERMTFRELADEYARRKLIPAQYVGARKVRGLRHWKRPRAMLRMLTEHFGARLIRAITWADLEEFKHLRLNTPTWRGDERAIATVNRELQLLRAVLNFARRNQWLAANPFNQGDPLILQSEETQRERLLTPDEERRLLAACRGVARAHLRPILICALDTAMRWGEIRQLEWTDVDFANRLIRIRATTTKTLRARVVGMTERLFEELEKLARQRELIRMDDRALVFGVRDNIKKGFAAICREAGVRDLRFHDLRHAATTRMIAAGVPDKLAMKITGHSQMTTFMRYINTDVETARQTAEALDLARRESQRMPE
jgi:integrase